MTQKKVETQPTEERPQAGSQTMDHSNRNSTACQPRRKITFDRKLSQFRNRATGRFMGLGAGITRVRVNDGVVFIIDQPEPCKPPTKEAVAEWGEWA